jgi:HK97 gp10 family phage protein
MSEFIPSPLCEEEAKVLAQPAIDEAADAVLDWARGHCPVDTGELRDSIHLEEGEEVGSKRVVVETDHWIYPEFGTSSMPAEPFMRPAIDSVGLHR